MTPTEMETAIQLLASTISEQGGQLQAMQAILLGICYALPAESEVADIVRGHLERSYASALPNSLNPPALAAFEALMDLAKKALAAPPIPGVFPHFGD